MSLNLMHIVSFYRITIPLVLSMFVIASGLPAADPKYKKKEEDRDILHEKDLLSVSIKFQVGGPKVTAEDLAGRTVLVIYGAGDKQPWNEFMVRMGNQYCNAAPPGGVITLFILPDKRTEYKWWVENNGSPFVSFFDENNFALPGCTGSGGPRYVLFDADGKMLGDICHDGRDLSGNSVHTYDGTRFIPDSVRKTVESGSGSVVRSGDYKECADLMRALVEGALTSTPLTPVLSALRSKAKDGKGAARAEATDLLEGFRDYLVHQKTVIERNITSNPVLAARALKRILAQLAGDKELSAPFDHLQEHLKTDKSLQEELTAGEILCSVRKQAAVIQWGLRDPDFPVRPKDKVQGIKQGLESVVSKFPRSRSAQTAMELKKAYTDWVGKAIDPSPW